MGRLRSVEGARGVAALAVLTFHVGIFTPGVGPLERYTLHYGFLGVQLFFLLSGFLLFRPFAQAIIRQTPWPSVRRYARSRFLRIAPAYWVVLTFVIALNALWPPFELSESTGPLTAWHVFSNYALIWLPFGVHSGVVHVSWTLCIEVAFYALLPVAAIVANHVLRRVSSSNWRASLLAAVLLPIFPYSYIHSEHSGAIWLPGYLDEFAIGMLLAIAFVVKPRVRMAGGRLLLVAGIAVLVGGSRLYSFGPALEHGKGSGVLYPRLMELGFALILASILGRDERTLSGRVLASKPLVFTGTISYGIYLWHMVVILPLYRESWWNEWSGLLVTVTATLLLASLSWFVIERPAMASKDRRRGTGQPMLIPPLRSRIRAITLPGESEA